MGFIELLLIALGLSMDAFAVAVTDGLCNKGMKKRWIVMIALVFGVFQGIMPTAGYFLGQTFAERIQKYDHVIALILLTIIGGKMLIEAVENKNEECDIVGISFPALLLQGIATSIDALAVGISFSVLSINIFHAAAFISSITFICSIIGVLIGMKFGAIFNKKAQIAGGLILIVIGVKIFIEHTFFQ